MSWIRRKLWVLAVAVLAGRPVATRFTLGFLTPFPVQPWSRSGWSRNFNHKNEGRTPIMPPVRDGFPPPICEDAPSDAEVLRAMPRVPRGVPYIYETFRDDIVIVKNRVVDKIDPPRLFSAGRAGATAPLPLGVRGVLHRVGAVRLPVPDLREEAAGPGAVHRQGPPAPVRRPGPGDAAPNHTRPDPLLNKCGVRSSECGIEGRNTADCAGASGLQFRIPNSALRILMIPRCAFRCIILTIAMRDVSESPGVSECR